MLESSEQTHEEGRLFGALASSTCRDMLGWLCHHSIGSRADLLASVQGPMSWPVSSHLRMLEDAGLIVAMGQDRYALASSLEKEMLESVLDTVRYYLTQREKQTEQR